MNGEFVVFGQVRQFNTGSVNDLGEVQVGAVEPDRVNGVVNVIDECFGSSFGVKPYGGDGGVGFSGLVLGMGEIQMHVV